MAYGNVRSLTGPAAFLLSVAGCASSSPPSAIRDSSTPEPTVDSGGADSAPSLGVCEPFFELWITQQVSAGTSTPCQTCLSASCSASCTAWNDAGDPAPSSAQLDCIRAKCDAPSCFTGALADVLQCMITSCGAECYAPDYDHCEVDANAD